MEDGEKPAKKRKWGSKSTTSLQNKPKKTSSVTISTESLKVCLKYCFNGNSKCDRFELLVVVELVSFNNPSVMSQHLDMVRCSNVKIYNGAAELEYHIADNLHTIPLVGAIAECSDHFVCYAE